MSKKATIKSLEKVFSKFTGTPEEIGEQVKKYLTDRKVFYRTAVPYEELYTIASGIVQATCYDDDGTFVRNTALVNMYTYVYQYLMFCDIDLSDSTFSNAWDFIQKYLGDVDFGDQAYRMQSQLSYLVSDILDDIDYNEMSTAAAMRKFVSGVTGDISSIDQEQLAKTVISALQEEVQKDGKGPRESGSAGK